MKRVRLNSSNMGAAACSCRGASPDVCSRNLTPGRLPQIILKLKKRRKYELAFKTRGYRIKLLRAPQRFPAIAWHSVCDRQFCVAVFCPAQFFYAQQFLFASWRDRGDLRHDARLGVVA